MNWSQVPWRTWEVIVIGLLSLVATFVIGVIAVIVAAVAGLAEPEDPGPILLVLVVIPPLLVLAVTGLWIGGRYRGAGLRAVLTPAGVPATSTLRALGLATAAVAAWFAVIQVGIGSLVEWASPGFFDDVQSELADLASGTTMEVAALVVAAVVLAPLWEEVFFRGLLFTGMERRFGFWPAALVSSIAFGLVHFEGFSVGSAYLIGQTAVLGFVLAWLLRRTGTLLAPILAHALNNLVAVGLLLATAS